MASPASAVAADTRGTASDLPVRVLVLGGTGLLGAAIGRALTAAGAEVTLLARRAVPAPRGAGNASEELSPSVRVLAGDVADHASLRAALDGVHHVIHAAGYLHPAAAEANPRAATELMIGNVRPLLRALRATPSTTLTYLSSGGTVYGASSRPLPESQACAPISAYGRGQLAAEGAVTAAGGDGLRHRIVRIANAYGPGQSATRGQGLVAVLLAAVRGGFPVPVFGDGMVTRDYVLAADVAAAVVGLTTMEPSASPAVVNVGTGQGHSVHAVLDVVEAVTGTRPTVTFTSSRPFDVPYNVLDVSTLAGLLPWSPTPLIRGIARTWQSLGERPGPLRTGV